jgi:hypothetical protein
MRSEVLDRLCLNDHNGFPFLVGEVEIGQENMAPTIQQIVAEPGVCQRSANQRMESHLRHESVSCGGREKGAIPRLQGFTNLERDHKHSHLPNPLMAFDMS